MSGKDAWSRLKAAMQLEEAELRHERQVTDWLDEAVRDFERRGGMEHVKGKGKPLPPPEGDPLSAVLKTANVKPPWLELRHDIRRELRRLAEAAAGDAADRQRIESELARVNAKITRYNALVPHYSLQKAKVALSTLAEQARAWE